MPAERSPHIQESGMNNTLKKWAAEFAGTFWLTFGGCGSAVLAAAFPELGIGFAGVSLAFGLTVLTGAYAFGPVSGGHFNPAVSVGLAVAGRFNWSELAGYVVSQVLGAVVAAAVLFLIASGKSGFVAGGFATNGFGELSPGGFDMKAALVCEVVLTAVFLLVILGATAQRAASGFAGLTIGLCLTLIHLVSIPVTNTSVNPARSTGPALFADTAAIDQLWLFWLAPIVGAVIGAVVHRLVLSERDA
jgi:aquaporin Z